MSEIQIKIIYEPPDVSSCGSNISIFFNYIA